MPHAFFSLTWFGDRCLRVSFTQSGPPEAVLARVHAAFRRLSAPDSRPRALIDLTPAYHSLLLTFDPMTLDHAEAERAVGALLAELSDAPPTQSGRTVEVPVCYDASVAPDLADVAAVNGLQPQDVIELHTSPTYTVAFIGFSPGFPYLVGLPPKLHTPRLATPRTRVEAGSVAIAGDQAGIYPQATPGGWRIIGRTPVRLFDPNAHQPALLPGDRVKFVRISLDSLRLYPTSEEGAH